MFANLEEAKHAYSDKQKQLMVVNALSDYSNWDQKDFKKSVTSPPMRNVELGWNLRRMESGSSLLKSLKALP